MRRTVITDYSGGFRHEEAEPVCGEDFCDNCSCCLVCGQAGDGTEADCEDGWGHAWVRLESEAP